MELFSNIKNLAYFFVTDPVLVGSTGLFGVILAILGFWVTIVQARRANKAATAAKKAAEGLAQIVFGRERLVELNLAVAHIESAIDRMTQSRFEPALVFVDFALTKCTQIHELLSVGEKRRFYKTILRLRKLAESLTSAQAEGNESDVSVELALEARSIASVMSEMAAKLRYAYDDEGVTNDNLE